jgi:hypothetical protein
MMMTTLDDDPSHTYGSEQRSWVYGVMCAWGKTKLLGCNRYYNT